MPATPLLRIVIVGHVDHGKSTLIGRLLHDTGTIAAGKADSLRQACARRGMPFEWAFLMDALQAERDQGITIDAAHIPFRSPRRDYIIIDAPGHREFLKNMLTGASEADAALLVIDAAEGMREQSRRHACLLHLLGIRQVVVAVNKMDRVDFSHSRFEAVASALRDYLGGFGLSPSQIVPVSALLGDGLVDPSPQMDWYGGPTLLDALDTFSAAPGSDMLPLRFPVQDVYKFDDRRIVAGRIESGRLAIGDRLLFSPSGKTATVSTLETWNAPATVSAGAGDSIGVTLVEPVFIERGQVASRLEDPPFRADMFRGRLFWFASQALAAGQRYRLRLATAEHAVTVDRIESVIDVETLGTLSGDRVERGSLAEVFFRSANPIALDAFSDCPANGRFILVDGGETVGGGIVSLDGLTLPRCAPETGGRDLSTVPHKVTPEDRRRVNRHRGGIIWLTGLSGSGKSTIAMEAERRLFGRGYHVFVLDGDNIRQGLNADLGFSPEDRTENIRRIGEVANLFVQAGVLVIAAFISPYRADRERARRINPAGFREVYLSTCLAECERRDPRGLYRKARAGQLLAFTGVSAPYEPPPQPALTLDTEGQAVEDSVNALIAFIEREFAVGARAQATDRTAV